MTYSKRASDAQTQDGRRLWDLESWDVAKQWSDPKPSGVPADATQDFGYVARDGVQHCVYRRVVRKADA